MVTFHFSGAELDQTQIGAVAVKLMTGIVASERVVGVPVIGILAFPVSVCHPAAVLRVPMKDETYPL